MNFGLRRDCGPSSSGALRVLAVVLALAVISVLVATLHLCAQSHVTTHHNHHNFIIRTVCPFCKLSLDIHSPDGGNARYLTDLLAARSLLVDESSVYIPCICPASLTSRAPPSDCRET